MHISIRLALWFPRQKNKQCFHHLHDQYLGAARNKVDEAWARIGDIRPISITRDDIIKIGKDPAIAVKFPESFGLGPDAYVGRLDVLHQIHCLDALRREANFDYYYGFAYADGLASITQLHKLHLSHCIYLLLEKIMCNANLEVYPHFWYRDTIGAVR
jgi:Mycotoxin biosynthesis protein UstYa